MEGQVIRANIIARTVFTQCCHNKKVRKYYSVSTNETISFYNDAIHQSIFPFESVRVEIRILGA